MTRALVVDADAANRLALGGALPNTWLDTLQPLPPGVERVDHEGITYLVGGTAKPDARLLVIAANKGQLLGELRVHHRLECLHRILRAALSQFSPGYVKIPLDWQVFHSGSLISFHTDRLGAGARARAYLDVRPEGLRHVFAYRICTDDRDQLTQNRIQLGPVC